MKKIDEMKAKLGTLKTDVQALLDANKVKEAQDKMKEVRNLQEAIELQQEIEDMAKDDMQNKATEYQVKKAQDKTKENANVIRAMIKKVTGGNLTDAENELLLPTISKPEGANGEGYILPQDIQTKIHEKMREFKSLREVLGYIPGGALTGSFPIEDFETVSELIDFADGTDGTDEKDIKFKNVTYSLKEKAGFIKLSNTLMAMTDNDLIDYVARIFAKKAAKTENRMAITALKKGKTAKALNSWQDLKSSINIDLDPAVLYGTVILTNQDGFDFLDKQLDTTGRPILQPNPTNPTDMKFKGFPIVKFANTMLPTEDGKAPIFYGNLAEAVQVVDWKGQVAFKASSEAGFWSNTTVARMIEFVDVVQSDNSDKCYIYGEINTTPEETGTTPEETGTTPEETGTTPEETPKSK